MQFFHCYGLICEITPKSKGYTRLTVSTNIPFKQRLLKFNVWDTLLLQSETMEPFRIGEEVYVEYSYKNSYPQLTRIIPSRVDNCPICDSSLEGIDAQRWECDGCTSIPEEHHKKRVNAEMKLVSSTLNEYQHSRGYKLEFYYAVENTTFSPVIFEDKLLFNHIPKLSVGHNYRVAGWISPNGRYLDVTNIY